MPQAVLGEVLRSGAGLKLAMLRIVIAMAEDREHLRIAFTFNTRLFRHTAR